MANPLSHLADRIAATIQDAALGNIGAAVDDVNPSYPLPAATNQAIDLPLGTTQGLKQINIGALPGAPVGVNGSTLGCFRYLPRPPQQALPINCPLSYGIGLDPSKTSPGVVVGITVTSVSNKKSSSFILRPGDWVPIPEGFTTFGIFAADGAEQYSSLFNYAQSQYPLGFVYLLSALSPGLNPTWNSAKGNLDISNVLNYIVGAGTPSLIIFSPRSGYVQINQRGLDGANVTLNGTYKMTVQNVSLFNVPAVTPTNDLGALEFDSIPNALQTGSGALPNTGRSYNFSGFTAPAGAGQCAVGGIIPVRQGLNLLVCTLSVLGASPAIISSAVTVSWAGDEPLQTGQGEGSVTLFDGISAANTAITTTVLTVPDCESLNLTLICNIAPGANTINVNEVIEAGGISVQVANIGLNAGNLVYSQAIGIGVSTLGFGISIATGVNRPLPRQIAFVIPALGVGVTGRVVITGRKKVL